MLVVGVNLLMPFVRCGGSELAHVGERVCPPQLIVGGERSVVRDYVVEQTAHQKPVVDGRKPFRTFRMAGAHLMACAVGVGDVSGQQFDSWAIPRRAARV